MQKLGLVVLLLLVGVGLGGAWFWRQVTYLPDWYTQPSSQEIEPVLSGTDVDQPEERQAIKQELARRVVPVPRESVTSENRTANPVRPPSTHSVALDAKTFNEFVVSSIPQTPQSEVIFPAIKAVNTEINQGQVQVGVVVNTAELPLEQLPEVSRLQLERTLQNFPFLKGQEVYLGVMGQPRLEAGQVILGKEATIQIAGLKMTVAEFSKQTGIPSEVLEQRINLQLGQLNIQDINFTDETAVLSGSVNDL